MSAVRSPTVRECREVVRLLTRMDEDEELPRVWLGLEPLPQCSAVWQCSPLEVGLGHGPCVTLGSRCAASARGLAGKVGDSVGSRTSRGLSACKGD